MIGLVARATFERYRRSPRERQRGLPWIGFALALASAKLTLGALRGADDLLTGVVSGFVLPFAVFAIVTGVLGDKGMRGATQGFVAIGAEPARAAIATTLVALAISAVAGGVLAGFVALVAHGPADPPVYLDAPLSAGVGALGGAAYAVLFCAGASFGEGSAGRSAALALDILFGGGGALGLFLPRAHVLALMGAEPALDMSRRASSLVLVSLVAFYLSIVVRRARRPL